MIGGRCACPFCGYQRSHTPPTCSCRVCGDGRNRRGGGNVALKVAEIPKPYKDVADVLSASDGEALYEAMIRDAKPGMVWMIDHLEDVRGHDLTTAQGAAAACEDLVDLLLSQPPVARARYVRDLAEKLEVSEREVRQTLNEAVRARADYYKEHPGERPKPMPVRIDIE